MPNPDEVLAATRNWVERVVIGLNLCPFAGPVYRNGQVRFVVSEARHLDAFLEDLDRELDLLAAADPAEIDTTLLIHPDLMPDFDEFNAFMEIAEHAVIEHELEGIIQVASFHPAFRFADSDQDDIENFTNRSPYPTLQLLREASVERAMAEHLDLDEMYARNSETVLRLGPQGLKRILDGES